MLVAVLGIGIETAREGVLPSARSRWWSATQSAAVPQVRNVRAHHRYGQTFITWTESMPLVGINDPTYLQVWTIKQQPERNAIRYRIYRSTTPITTVEGMKPIGEVGPMTGWNTDIYGISPQDAQHANARAIRYVIDDGAPPLLPNTGLFVFNPSGEGAAYYAVTATAGGRENRQVTDANRLESAVDERPGQGEPVRQRVVKPTTWFYVDNPTLEYYTRWEVPPNASVAGKPFDYLVALPPTRTKRPAAGLYLHGLGGSLDSFSAWWFNADKGAIAISSTEQPYDWWTGYPDRWWTSAPLVSKSDWQSSVVHPYSQRRLLSFLEWAARRYSLDLTRSFAAGSSMGGAGALMLAIHYPDRVAWAASWVGVHVPLQSPTFRSSYQLLYGDPEWRVRFEDGTPVWDHFDDVKYLENHVGQDVGLLAFSNGKNDDQIGWGQAVSFYRALQETRRPHVFVWGQNGHGERALMPAAGGEREMPLDLSTDQTLPAFTHGTLDDDPGNGDPANGAPQGQVNLYMTFETGSIVDTPDQWEMTVGVLASAPKDRCTVDVTPRRLRGLKLKPGDLMIWTSTPIGARYAVQSGTAVVDRWGLVTLNRIVVSKGRNRLVVRHARPRDNS